MSITPQDTLARARTRAGLEHSVIGLNRCPFAKAPQVKSLREAPCHAGGHGRRPAIRAAETTARAGSAASG